MNSQSPSQLPNEDNMATFDYSNYVLAWTAMAALKILPKPKKWVGESRFNTADGGADDDE